MTIDVAGQKTSLHCCRAQLECAWVSALVSATYNVVAFLQVRISGFFRLPGFDLALKAAHTELFDTCATRRDRICFYGIGVSNEQTL